MHRPGGQVLGCDLGVHAAPGDSSELPPLTAWSRTAGREESALWDLRTRPQRNFSRSMPWLLGFQQQRPTFLIEITSQGQIEPASQQHFFPLFCFLLTYSFPQGSHYAIFQLHPHLSLLLPFPDGLSQVPAKLPPAETPLPHVSLWPSWWKRTQLRSCRLLFFSYNVFLRNFTVLIPESSSAVLEPGSPRRSLCVTIQNAAVPWEKQSAEVLLVCNTLIRRFHSLLAARVI